MVLSNSQWLANPDTGYEIDQSIRFNDDDAAYLYRDNDAAQTDTKKFTYSVWIKRGAITGGTNTGLLSGGAGTTSGRSDFIFTAGSATGDSSNNDALKFDIYTGGWTQIRAEAKLRDPGAWSHIVLVYDAANSTANDTLIMYHNGSRLTLDSTSGVPNNLSLINANGQRTRVGADASGTPVEYDGYMAEINMIDGQALTPASFGETNDDGVWIPKKYSGAYGNNGFFIDGRDSSDLGDDESGNGNDFTSTGLAAADQVTDTPTDNFCVLSPIDKNSNFTLSDGNLTNANGTNADAACFGTIAFPASDTDGFYWEIKMDSMGSTGFAVLIADEAVNQTDISADPTTQPAEGNLWAYRRYKDDSNGGITGVGSTGSFSDYGPAAVNGNVVGFCVKNGKLFIAINNSWLESSDPDTEANPAFSNLTGNLRVGVCRFTDTGTDTTTLDFGQTAFDYTPPTGAKAIKTSNLPTPTIKDGSAHFQATIYTGDGGSSHEINQTGNSSFEPSLVWIKSRSAATNNVLQDQVRGNFVIYSDLANAQGATGGGWVKSFDSDGFTTDVNTPINDSGETFVAWQWKANGSGSSNEDGSINTTATSVDTTSGFSISTYTGTGSNATVGHGLGAVPKMILIKDTTNSESWIVYHEGVGNDGNVYLNLTNAKATQAVFQDTTPTSSVFSLGTTDGANKSSAGHVAYCFAEVPGFSSIGTYEANAATDGPFIYTGFKPAFVLIKNIDATEEWWIQDSAREPFNGGNMARLATNSGAVEADNVAWFDFVSNGLKVRYNGGGINASGTHIYMAFAEHPFGGDGVAPATAR